MLLEQSTNVSTMHGKIENVQASVDGIHEAVMVMTQKMERIPQVSDAQSNDIQSLLLALQAQISGLSNTSPYSPGTAQSTSTRKPGDDARDEKEAQLKKSIQRLQTLTSQKEANVHGEEAEYLVTDLKCILKAVYISENSLSSTISSAKSGVLCTSEEIGIREIKRLCSLIASSHSVDLNSRRKSLISVHCWYS